ncbi:MAG: hypothetical protein IPK19_25195 [Chloroflexi bacterium]|nr:hypothetical protein [Chloroflexota bacterium]
MAPRGGSAPRWCASSPPPRPHRLTPSPDLTPDGAGHATAHGAVWRRHGHADPAALDLGSQSLARHHRRRPLETPLNAATAVAGLQLPNIEAINQTATALAQGASPRPARLLPGLGGPTGGPLEGTGTATAVPLAAGTGLDPAGRRRAGLTATISRLPPGADRFAAGSTIEIFWAWFANTRQQVQDHMNACVYDVRLDGEPLAWRQYAQPITEQSGQFVVYWYVPAGPLARGEHEITYTVTWRSQISDGLKDFGPGTGTRWKPVPAPSRCGAIMYSFPLSDPFSHASGEKGSTVLSCLPRRGLSRDKVFCRCRRSSQARAKTQANTLSPTSWWSARARRDSRRRGVCMRPAVA